jgi:hypothetical protein
MNKAATLFFTLIVIAFSQRGFAGDEGVLTKTSDTTAEKVPLDIFETENAYVFKSDLNHGGVSIRQDELQNDFYYAHRFHIGQNWYLRGGVAYDRFDFSETAAPVPTVLQSAAGVISIDYMHGADIGAMIEVRPGIYTEEDFRADAFDCPITVMRFFVLKPNKLYVMAGANYSFLRRTWDGIVPIAGLVWVVNEKFRVMAVPPEPRLVYSVNKQLDVYLGGELEGGSFRTDRHSSFRGNPFLNKFNEAPIDYTDIRAGGGIVWSPTDQIDLDLGGGCSIQREFDYENIDQRFRSDPAPFVRFELKAKF